MTTAPAVTISVSIDRDPASVYRYVTDPRNLPHWAPGFAQAVHEDSAGWVVQTSSGLVRITFAADNKFGVLDHRVSNGREVDVLNPMRVVANGDGAEVLFTLFQPPGSSDEEFDRDVGLVTADLRLLKALLERGAD